MGNVISATWFITSKCNLNCSYCFTHFDKEFPQEDSSIEVGRGIVDFLLLISKSPMLNLGFFGGEPLLKYNLLQETVEYAKAQAAKSNRKFSFGMTTNATLLNLDKVKWLLENDIVPLVSLDGMPHPDNKRLFCDGSHSAEKALSGALTLLGFDAPVTVRWTVHPDQVGHMYDDLKSLVELGFKTIAIEMVYEAEWTKEKLAEYERQMRKVANLYLEYMRNNIRLNIKPIEDALNMFRLDKRQINRCGLALGGVGVGMDGNIYPCHRFVSRRKPVLGSVFTGFKQPITNQVRCWNINQTRSESDDCKNCPVKLRCPGGGCLASNLDMCGDEYITPDIFCTFLLINQRITNDTAFILHGEENELFRAVLENQGMRT